MTPSVESFFTEHLRGLVAVLCGRFASQQSLSQDLTRLLHQAKLSRTPFVTPWFNTTWTIAHLHR